jgi:quinolinate synthase
MSLEHIVGPSPRPRPSVADTEASRAVAADNEIRSMTQAELIAGIQRLRSERDAIVLAHNYQIPEIQDLADYVGDSLQLSQEAARSDAPLIVFCGVHFMAETAAILCPDQRVLIPDPEAGCSLAATVTAEEVRSWKADHPDTVVVAYVNTDAAVKAEADYCCTSANAVEIVQSIPDGREILFLPDMFLGLYVERMAGRKLHLWLGECHVHAGIRADDVSAALDAHRGADLLLHPECGCVSQCLQALDDGDLPPDRTHLLGTGGMVRHAESCTAPVDLVGTEVGLLHRLRSENPNRQFVPVKEDAICDYMKAITLPKLFRSLRDLVSEVTVSEPTATGARQALERMIAAV